MELPPRPLTFKFSEPELFRDDEKFPVDGGDSEADEP
jgi:hypothetical protein